MKTGTVKSQLSTKRGSRSKKAKGEAMELVESRGEN
jgi:hypothetical protein